MKAIFVFTVSVIFVVLVGGLLVTGSTIANPGAQTCLVPGDYATIQAAVDDPACTEIKLGSGVFKENVTISRTVTIQGQGTANTVVEGAGIGNVFTITLKSEIRKPEPITVTLNRLAITNGQTGVFIDLNGDIQREESTIYVYLKNCLISDNAKSGILQAPFRGKTETHVDTCTISGNSSLGILNNPAWSGGSADLIVTFSTISNNSGVGISNPGCPRGFCKSSVFLSHSTVSGNLGSGIFASWDASNRFSPDFRINNSTISGNSAERGGGIYSCGQLSLRDSTVSNNSADYGGGIYIRESEPFPYGCHGMVLARNNIVANNLRGGDCIISKDDEYSATIFADNGYNIVEDGTCITSETSSSGDPLLGPLAYNGGPTATHALMPDSPAIDAGYSDFCPDTDQRGYIRPLDGDKNRTAVCDIGSYEHDHFDFYIDFPIISR